MRARVNDSQTGTTAYTYDPQGNLATRNGVPYQFDYGNRLRNVIGYEGSYAYDANGRRVLQISAAGTIGSFYDQSGQLIYQQDRSGGTHDYLYLGGHLVAIRDYNASGVATAMRYQHTDALDSIIRQTDKNGVEIPGSGNIYDAYGGLHGTAAQDGPGYTGQVMDASTGLTYMQQRYYDPSVGRFLSMDPVDASSTNGSNLDRYWYANDNPYRFTDSDGRGSCGAGGAGVDCPHEKQAKALREKGQTITGSLIPGNTGGNEVRVIQVASPSKQQMAVSQQGLRFIERHEGYVDGIYNDSAGNPTIGYGHLIKGGEDFSNGINQEQAGGLLAQDAGLAVNIVNGKVTATLSQTKFDALVDFTYNVGGRNFGNSMLLNNINSGKAITERNFTDWNHAGGETVNGLTTRRIDEFNLFSTGDYGGQ